MRVFTSSMTGLLSGGRQLLLASPSLSSKKAAATVIPKTQGRLATQLIIARKASQSPQTASATPSNNSVLRGGWQILAWQGKRAQFTFLYVLG